MSAADHINPHQVYRQKGESLDKTMYHGSPHVFQEGDHIDATHSTLQHPTPVAYASTDPNGAAFFGTAKNFHGQQPLFVGVHEVTSPDATAAPHKAKEYRVSEAGYTVGKLHGYVRKYNAPGLSSKMKERWL